MLFSRPGSIISKALVSVALCFASAPAYANAACQGGNCVIPIREAAPAPPVVAESVEMVDEGGGLGILPIIALVAAAALVIWLLVDDDDDEESESP